MTKTLFVRPRQAIDLLIPIGLVTLVLLSYALSGTLFHSLTNLICIVFASTTFVLGWNAQRFTSNSFLPFIGIGFLAVSVLDAAHLLVAVRADLIPSILATQNEVLWFSARLAQGLVWLIAPVFLGAKVSRGTRGGILVFLIGASLYITAVTRVGSSTPRLLDFLSPVVANLVYDFFLVTIYLLAAAHLIYRRQDLGRRFYWTALSSVGFGALGQAIALVSDYTLNYRPGLLVNALIGVSIFLTFTAVFQIGYLKPFEHIFQDLKEQTDLLQDVFDVNPSAMVVVSGPDFTLRVANPAYQALQPHPEIDSVGRPYREVWPAQEGYPDRTIFYRQVITSGQPIYLERHRIDYQNGDVRYVNAYLKPTTWKGEPAALAVLWEISSLELAQQEAQQAAQEANQWAAEMQTLMDAVPAIVLITVDPQARLITGNQFAYQRFHLSPDTNLNLLEWEEHIPRPYRLFKDGREIPATDLPLQTVAGSGRALVDYNLDMLFPDGSVAHLFGSVQPLLNDEGKPQGAVATFLDITRLLETEQALRESEERFRGLVESIDDMVFTFDRDLRFTFMSSKSIARFKLTPPDILGKTVAEVFGEEIAEEHIAPLNRALQGEAILYPWTFLWKDIHIEFESTLSPIHNNQGEVIGVVGVGHDITRMKQTEAELARSNRELEQFAYVASHDLQEPLRKVRFFAERLAERNRTRLDEEDRDFINRMQSATQRMQTMINDLLTYSRVSTKAQPFSQVNLNEILKDVMSDLETRVERSNAKVEICELPVIDADPLQMRQLLQNLIGNALKYHQPDQPPYVQISSRLARRKGEVQIIIEDNGIGIAEQHLDRIFEPFERLHGRSEYEGSGMGLAICRKIVERHAGKIEVRSTLGKGSCFIVTLPIHPTRIERRI